MEINHGAKADENQMWHPRTFAAEPQVICVAWHTFVNIRQFPACFSHAGFAGPSSIVLAAVAV